MGGVNELELPPHGVHGVAGQRLGGGPFLSAFVCRIQGGRLPGRSL